MPIIMTSSYAGAPARRSNVASGRVDPRYPHRYVVPSLFAGPFVVVLSALLSACGGGGGGGPFTPETIPAALADLQLSAKGRDTITLNWTTDPTDASIAEFRIVRDDGASWTTAATARSFDDTGLATQTEYCYQVSAINARGAAGTATRRCLASGWRNAVVASAPDGAGMLGSSLALDPAGVPVVTYVLATPNTATSGDLWLARPAGDTWAKQRIAGHAAGHALAVDALGSIHIAYTDAPTSKLIYARSVDGWTPMAIDDADVATRPSLAVDALGGAGIAFVSGGVKYATNRSGSWTTAAVAPGHISAQNALSLDAAGGAHVVFIASNSDVQLAVQAADGWSIETTLPLSGGLCAFTAASMTLANGGLTHLALTQTCHSDANIAHAGRSSTGLWQSDVLPYESGYQMFRAGDPAIAASGDGAIHIAASASGFAGDNQHFVRYWTNVSGTWQGYTLTNDAGAAGSLLADVAGDRHAVYATARDIHYLTTRF